MKTFDSVFEKIELITLKKFLGLLTTRKQSHGQHVILFNTLCDMMLPEPKHDTFEDVASYKRVAAYMQKGDEQTILKSALLHQSTFRYIFSQKAAALFEDIVVNHMEFFGQTRYLVRVGPRTWLPANPADFSVLRNDKGVSLACYAQVRTTATIVHKITNVEAAAKINEIINEAKPKIEGMLEALSEDD